ncbi:MAG: response regulator, partial [Vallitaleaceae bacterium]|nr:response regulator [Vallitaleaceae bacterium]
MLKVMIVDDEQIVRDGIRFIIEKSFQETIEIVALAKTGREAIELFEETRPHLVLMDIQMPGINGIDAIKAIQEIHSKVKIIIISAYEQFDYAKSGFELGVVDYLLKPIHKSRLENVLEKIVQEMEEERE